MLTQKEFLGLVAGITLLAILFTEQGTEIWKPFLLVGMLFTALWYFKK
ncbi:MAG: hypothetical protein U9Q99_01990 [Nanoarchaeota archaeon]|nr:hypothetical protein [Nanoarchaeota archaeon]